MALKKIFIIERISRKRGNVRGGSIDHAEQLLDELVRYLFVVLVFLCRIIEKDMAFVLVVVQVLQMQVVASGATSTLIAVQSKADGPSKERSSNHGRPHDRFEQLKHLGFRLVPHRSTRIDLRLHFGREFLLHGQFLDALIVVVRFAVRGR